MGALAVPAREIPSRSRYRPALMRTVSPAARTLVALPTVRKAPASDRPLWRPLAPHGGTWASAEGSAAMRTVRASAAEREDREQRECVLEDGVVGAAGDMMKRAFLPSPGNLFLARVPERPTREGGQPLVPERELVGLHVRTTVHRSYTFRSESRVRSLTAAKSRVRRITVGLRPAMRPSHPSSTARLRKPLLMSVLRRWTYLI